MSVYGSQRLRSARAERVKAAARAHGTELTEVYGGDQLPRPWLRATWNDGGAQGYVNEETGEVTHRSPRED